MIYSLSLKTACLAVGLILIALHTYAFLSKEQVQAWLRDFPRSQFWGLVLMAVATIWSWWLIKTIDLGEFDNWRGRLLIIIPVLGFLGWRYIEDFLAVRALGMCVLLAAEPLLEAAWMRPETGRLLLVSLVFAYIIAALFWIGMPYCLRDQIAWVSRTATRWQTVCLAGIAYGAALLIHALTLHR